MNVIKHFIDGKVFEGSSKRSSKVFNPATGEENSNVNLASKEDVDFAVQKAKKAFEIPATQAKSSRQENSLVRSS